MRTLYVDVVFAVNLLIDYLLLLATAQLTGTALLRIRFFLVSCIGSAYAILALVVPWTAHPILRLLIGSAMAVISFRGQIELWRSAALYLLLSSCLGGIIFAVCCYGNFNGWVLLLSAGLFYLLLKLFFYQAAKFGRRDLMNTTIVVAGKKCRLRTLRDTGNLLRNPADGRPVLVVEESTIRSLWSEEIAGLIKQKQTPEITLMRMYDMGCHRFSLLPYKTIGNDGGLLLAFRSDYVCLDGHLYKGLMIALTPQPIGGSAYQALWGGKEDCHVIHSPDSETDQTTQAG